MTNNALSDGLATTHKPIYRPSSGTKFIKPTLADTHKYTAGYLKRLAVVNQISQNYLLQLTQRNRQEEEDLHARLTFQGVKTDLSQLFPTGSGTEMAVYKTLPEPRQTSWYEHAFYRIHLLLVYPDNAAPGYYTYPLPKKLGDRLLYPLILSYGLVGLIQRILLPGGIYHLTQDQYLSGHPPSV